LRQKVYTNIFIRLGDYDYLTQWYEEAIRANVLLIQHVEDFIIHAGHVHNNPPPLEYFVDDVVTFVNILQTPHPTERKALPRSRFWELRLDSWKEHWGGQLNDEKILTEYVEGLCDAVFGVWQKPGRTSKFHEDGAAKYKCADHIFTTLNSGRSDYPKVISDHRLFDAAYIETCGPFRFKTTNRLDRHLTVQGRDILLFTDWRKWMALCYHTVLQTVDPNTGFEVMTNYRWGRAQPSRQSARATGSIPISLLLMEYFCFCIDALEYDIDVQVQRPRRSFFTAKRKNPLSKRRAIAARLNVDLAPLQRLKDVANRRQHDEWGLTLHLEPFDERASRLLETLLNWKPETFWEMRYPGYGGVDPIGLYGFYFAIILGLITMFGFTLAIAQTVAAFRQIRT